MITSADNLKIKSVRELLDRRGRQKQGACLIEGVRLIEDAIRAGFVPALFFCVPEADLSERARRLSALVATTSSGRYVVSPSVFASISDTVSSQGVVAVLRQVELPLPNSPTLTIVLDGIQDPGNVGTILRSAAAAGAGAALLTQGTADPWSPKVLRAGMGAHFRLPIRHGLDWSDVAGHLTGQAVWVADASGEVAYTEPVWREPAALVIGSEGHGPSEAALAHGARMSIPMAAATESLNAAMAATVILFEAARQRQG